MIFVGELSLWVALLMAAWCAAMSFRGGATRRDDLIASGERALHASFGFTVVASLGLWTAILSGDFSLRYVASVSSSNLPLVYKIAAFWGGQAGSLLFSCLLLSACSTAALLGNRRANRGLMSFVTGTLALILVFLLSTVAFSANPYERLDWVPPDGRGLDPQLQHAGMVIHPPILYLGYVAASIPFTFGVAGLMTRHLDAVWLAVVRRWAMVSWFFLTIGIMLGMWWAYGVVGWSGNWARDSVENGSLWPWVTSTAFLHSLVVQEKRGILRAWNVVLMAVTFLLSVVGTFMTRGAGIEAVRSLARSPVDWWLAGFLIVSILATTYLVVTRLDDLRSTGRKERNVSREAFTRRRYGGHIVHVGIATLFVAFAGLAFTRTFAVTLRAGETYAAVDPFGHTWRFTNQGISQYEYLNREVTAIAVETVRDGTPMGLIESEKRQYVDSRKQPTFDPTTEVGIMGSLREDVSVALSSVKRDESAEIHITFNPLVIWVWIAGGLMALGGLIVMWPRATATRAPAPAQTMYASTGDLAELAEAAIRLQRARRRGCPSCGPRPEPDAVFCSNCGRFLSQTCIMCEAPVENIAARFCTSCGVSFAA